jgi:hypothetical protein
MKKFAYGILAGVGGTLAAIMSVFLAIGIFAPDRLPAPAIARVVHLDEKLRFIHEHKDIQPTVLAVGSSIAWRQISGEAFESVAGGPKHFLNGATVYMKTHQTRKFARFLTAHYRTVHTLLVVTSLPDFEDCTDDREPMFDAEDAARYAFKRWPAAYFYLQYFAPMRYLNAALSLPQRRIPFSGDLYIDQYGSGPVIVSPETKLGLRYGEFEVDRACVYKLAELSQDMTRRGIRTMIVFAPVHPDYRQRYPASTHAVAAIVDKIRAETEGDNSFVMVLHDDKRFTVDDFFDAFHLQWPAAQRLSLMIASAMEKPGSINEFKEGAETTTKPGLPSMSMGAPPELTKAETVKPAAAP